MSDEPRYRGQSGSPWLVLGIVVAATVGGVIVLGVFYWIATSGPDQLPVKAADRDVLVMAGDLQTVIGDFVLVADAESIRKLRWPDDTIELVYSYRHPDSTEPFRLHCEIVVKNTRAEARDAYRSRLARTLDDLESEYVIQSHDEWFSWGETSNFSALTESDKPRGYSFIALAGEKLFAIELEDLALDDSQQFVSLIMPALDRLQSYDPRGR